MHNNTAKTLKTKAILSSSLITSLSKNPGWSALNFSSECFSQDTHHPYETNASISFFPLQVAGEFNFGTATKKGFIASTHSALESEWGGKSFIKQILQH